MKTKAVVVGRRTARTQWGEKRFYTWLRIPAVWPNRLLTMVATEEEFLPYGVRTADAILVDVDPNSLYRHHSGFAADVEVLGVWTEEEGPTESEPGGPQGPAAAGS